jgi:hypothetical protein|mmetsp:Transcript_67793/g.108506  ORF Transcript_67793/g.108506 Transcript_67793/m.108506 type:complete len:86 (+) Transcript_67793:856-1113(+)
MVARKGTPSAPMSRGAHQNSAMYIGAGPYLQGYLPAVSILLQIPEHARVATPFQIFSPISCIFPENALIFVPHAQNHHLKRENLP